MKIQDLFEKWGLAGLKINVGFLSMDWKPEPVEQQAAWELYVELVTRVATQPLDAGTGDEKAALESVYTIIEITRNLLRERGRKAETFSKIAIILLNQKIRPFTTVWHKARLKGDFTDSTICADFRTDLAMTQGVLQSFAGMLADIAGVETIHELDQGALVEI